MAQGYNKSVSSTKAIAPKMDLGDLFQSNYTANVNESTKYQHKDQSIEINIDEYMDIEIKPEEPKKAWYEQLWDAAGDFFSDVGEVLAATGATIAVGATSILSGVADIGEMLVDGVTWVGAAGADLLGFDDAAKDMREFISRDLVSEANQAFYENTEIGKAINDASVLKYDSEVAQGIREVTTTVTEIATATALTVVTGGAAAPLVVGTVVGLGKAAESTYQTNGTDTNLLQEGGILLSGGLNGLSWMANGKLGAGAIEIGKDVASLGAKEVLSNMSKEMLNKEFILGSLKKGLASKQAIGNYVGATFMTANSAIPYITGEEEFNATAALKIVGKFTANLALNVAEDSFRDYVSGYKAGQIQATIETLEDLEPPISASTPLKQIDEKLNLVSRGVDLDATARQISVSDLLPYLTDPDMQAKLLAAGLQDEIDGLTKMEIGNAIKDLMEGMEKNGFDLDLTEAQLADIQKIIDNAAVDPIALLGSQFNDWVSQNKHRNLDAEFFASEEGQSMLKKVQSLMGHLPSNEYGDALDQDLGQQLSNFKRLYHIALIELADEGKIVDLPESMFNDLFRMAFNTRGIDDDDTIKYLQALADFNNGKLNATNANLLSQLIKKVDLNGYDQVVADRLRAFSGGYVADEKVDSIVGSCIYQTSDVFSQNSRNAHAMAYNNGQHSVMNLQYDTPLIRSNVNHESLHQISHSDFNFDPQTGARISLAGVQSSVFNPQTQQWEKTRMGLNESITEYFNRLTMGSEYVWGQCGYEPAVEKLEELVNLGIVSVDDLKKGYFSNDGVGLVNYMIQSIKDSGVKVKGDTFSIMFDNAISDDPNIRAQGLQDLSKLIKQITVKQSGSSGALGSFTNMLKGLFGK